MSISENERNQVWERYHGKEDSAIDPFGDEITKDDFVVDHIYPESKGGSDDIENLIPMSEESNQEKDDDLEGTINGYNFIVEKKSGSYGNIIGILYVDGEQVSL